MKGSTKVKNESVKVVYTINTKILDIMPEEEYIICDLLSATKILEIMIIKAMLNKYAIMVLKTIEFSLKV